MDSELVLRVDSCGLWVCDKTFSTILVNDVDLALIMDDEPASDGERWHERMWARLVRQELRDDRVDEESMCA